MCVSKHGGPFSALRTNLIKCIFDGSPTTIVTPRSDQELNRWTFGNVFFHKWNKLDWFFFPTPATKLSHFLLWSENLVASALNMYVACRIGQPLLCKLSAECFSFRCVLSGTQQLWKLTLLSSDFLNSFMESCCLVRAFNVYVECFWKYLKNILEKICKNITNHSEFM